jgi:hypothetical protein
MERWKLFAWIIHPSLDYTLLSGLPSTQVSLSHVYVERKAWRGWTDNQFFCVRLNVLPQGLTSFPARGNFCKDSNYSSSAALSHKGSPA